MEPYEVTSARSALQRHRSELDEAIQTSSVRGTQERVLLTKVAGLVESVMGIERAWRIIAERRQYELELESSEASRLRARVTSLEAANTDLSTSLNSLRASHERLQADYNAAIRDGEERLARVQDAKNAELTAWKQKYDSDVSAFLQSRVSETRASAAREQQVLLDSTVNRVESEWRARLEDSIVAVQSAQREASTTRSAADATARQLMAAEQRTVVLEGELATVKAELSRARSEISEHTAGGRALADEIMRLRTLLDLERSTHEQMLKLASVKASHQAESAAVSASTSIQTLVDTHKLEVDRLRRVYETAVATREEALAEWRGRYAEASARAEKAEALLREIDRQLVPAVGTMGAATLHGRAAAAAGLGSGTALLVPLGSPAAAAASTVGSMGGPSASTIGARRLSGAAGTGTGSSSGGGGLGGTGRTPGRTGVMGASVRQSPLRT